jgi:biopolymer transport protein ExbB
MRRFISLLVLTASIVLLACPVVLAQDTPTDATEAAPAAPAAAKGTVSLGDVIAWGGTIGYFIIFLSVITIMLIALHLIVLRRSKLCPAAAEKKIGGLIQEKKVDEVIEYVKKDNSLLSRMISGGLSRRSGGYGEMEQVMNDVAEDEAMRLEQGVGYFSLIAAIAPLCGLLGTVVGMILAFNEIATRGVVTPKELADPIQKALVTTCFGLIVAIPNVVAHTFFRNKLHRMLADLALVVEELMLPFRGMAAPAPSDDAAAPADASPGDAPAS